MEQSRVFQNESETKFLAIESVPYQEWGLWFWKKFKNPFLKELPQKSFIDFIKARHQDKGKIPTDMEQLQRQLPLHKPDFINQAGQIKATWIGHSNVVLQDGDITFLLDPVFSNRCSPIQFFGPSRYRRPACTLQELPKIDAVFLSHDHYDHFDKTAINWLHENRNPQFFVGANSDDIFPTSSKLNQMKWNQTKKLNIRGRIYEIYFFPVNHWSKRSLFDTCKRLWGGFVITTPQKKKIFYPGDTGYCGVFKQIGEKFKEIDLALIPIGAYHPRYLLSTFHIDPQQAVMVHKDIHSKKSIGVHWGTFPLGLQHYLAPREELKQAVQKYKLDPQEFICLQHGKSIIVNTKESKLKENIIVL